MLAAPSYATTEPSFCTKLEYDLTLQALQAQVSWHSASAQLECLYNDIQCMCLTLLILSFTCWV